MTDFINLILSSTLSLAVIGFICKLFLQYIDKREIEKYKSKVKIEGDLFLKRIEQEISLKKEFNIELGRWSNTLLSATNGLIGRLRHIQNNVTEIDEYYLKSTRYYICQYLCWEQIYRKNRNLAILSPVKGEILVSDLLKNVSITFRENSLSFPSIRSLEQKYIGESLIVDGQCISYKEFHDDDILGNYDVLTTFVNAILDNKTPAYSLDLIDKLEDLKKHFQSLLKDT